MTAAPRFPIEPLREALRKRVKETSYRQVAAEIGMSFSALRSFVDGDTKRPQNETLALMMPWYYARADATDATRREEYQAAIAFIGAHVRHNTKSKSVREQRLREAIDDLRKESD